MHQYRFALTDDDEDLMCLAIDEQPVSFKLAQSFGREMDFEENEFLNEIHQTDMISEEMIQAAKVWWKEYRDFWGR